MKTEIISFINEYQRGKCGIYPYRVAELVAIEFYIPMSEAQEYVASHIKNELKHQEGEVSHA
jgi:hypothetical protein